MESNMETYSCIRYGIQYGNIFLYPIWNSIWKHILVSNTAIYVYIRLPTLGSCYCGNGTVESSWKAYLRQLSFVLCDNDTVISHHFVLCPELQKVALLCSGVQASLTFVLQMQCLSIS